MTKVANTYSVQVSLLAVVNIGAESQEQAQGFIQAAIDQGRVSFKDIVFKITPTYIGKRNIPECMDFLRSIGVGVSFDAALTSPDWFFSEGHDRFGPYATYEDAVEAAMEKHGSAS